MATKKKAAPRKKKAAPRKKKAAPKTKAAPKKKAKASPTPERVARRALALEAVAYRGFLEAEPPAEAEVLRRELLQWLNRLKIADELEPHERELLERPAGEAEPDDIHLATWRSEGTAVLAWALGRLELPPHDAQVDVGALSRSLGFLGPGSRALLKAPALRPRAELERLEAAMCTLTWRLRQYGLEQRAVDLPRLCAKPPFSNLLRLDDLTLADGDLVLLGRSILELSQRDWIGLMGIAQERYQAAAWLLGDEPRYSQVDTPT